jgi:hypothetical protein
MFGRVSTVISGLAVALIVAFIVVVIFPQRHAAPSRPVAALSSETRAVEPTGHAPPLSLECIAERIRHAPAPFHWSYKRSTTSLGSADWEADISTNSIAGTLADSSGTFPIQAVRADSSAWNTAVSVLTAPLPASAFALLQDSPAPAPASVEKVGSEDTIKYLIDTSRHAPADASSIRKVSGPNGFVNGAIWVDRDGCPVKFVLDVEQRLGDGSAKKEHYEGVVTPVDRSPIRRQ